MAFAPQFTVSARLLRELEAVAALKAKIASATVQVAWTPQLARDILAPLLKAKLVRRTGTRRSGRYLLA